MYVASYGTDLVYYVKANMHEVCVFVHIAMYKSSVFSYSVIILFTLVLP